MNPIKYAYNVGVSGNGVVPGRPDDAFGVGWSRIQFSNNFVPFLRDTLNLGLDHEDAVELYYNVAATKWLGLTVDLQIVNPGLKKMISRTVSSRTWTRRSSGDCAPTCASEGGGTMRTTVVLMAVMLVLMAGCAATQKAKIEDLPAVCGFLAEGCDHLKPGAKGEAGLRYVNPKAEPTQYNKAMVEVVGFFGSDVRKVPPKDQQALVDLFQKTLTEALAKRYQVVDRPGPGVMRLQVAIMDAEAATPGARSISMAIPQRGCSRPVPPLSRASIRSRAGPRGR